MIINGYKYPRIKTVVDRGVKTYDLSLTNSKGLIETYELRKIEHELIDLSDPKKISINQFWLGFKIIWTLHYDEFIDSADLTKIKAVLEAANSGGQLLLTPRIDFPLRTFEVYAANSNFELGIHKGGADAKYNKGPVIQFATVNLEPDLKWYEPGERQSVTFVNTENIKFII
ncbi:MAG TPA: hypothetical protein VGK25_07410 [Ignavibacteria bacterium]